MSEEEHKMSEEEYKKLADQVPEVNTSEGKKGTGSCDECVYWMPNNPDSPRIYEEGICKRFPPVLIQGPDGHEGMIWGFPRTSHDDGCGEFYSIANYHDCERCEGRGFVDVVEDGAAWDEPCPVCYKEWASRIDT